MNINIFYQDELAHLMRQPFELNKRTGIKVAALPGVTYRTDLEKEGFPLLSLRKLNFSFIPEIMWFLSGSNNVNNFLNSHTKIWNSFAETDGKVTSAYGERWRFHFDVDQLQSVIEKLKVDPSDRHGVVIMWDPKQDLTTKQKNVPCPVMFTLNIISGRLNLHLIVRSNDAILGMPTDIAGFALLQMIIAQELGVRPGIYTHSVSNLHVYENHKQVISDLLSRNVIEVAKKVELILPDDTYNRASLLDETLIEEIKTGIKDYNPYPPILKIPIAL